MSDRPFPDPALTARLEASGEGVAWAARRVVPWQHEEIEGEWSPNAQLWHLLAVERENFQPRIHAILNEDRPQLQRWDSEGSLAEGRTPVEILDYAAQFVAERARTAALFANLTPDQWRRTGIWPDGNEIDLAWLAEKALWHALDHTALLLDLHQELDHLHAR